MVLVVWSPNCYRECTLLQVSTHHDVTLDVARMQTSHTQKIYQIDLVIRKQEDNFNYCTSI